jgi:hypothetical protein
MNRLFDHEKMEVYQEPLALAGQAGFERKPRIFGSQNCYGLRHSARPGVLLIWASRGASVRLLRVRAPLFLREPAPLASVREEIE